MGGARGSMRAGGAEPEARWAYGRSRRRRVPRGAHAAWRADAPRPDPIALLKEANAARIPELVSLKMSRMAASPFGFFRGAAPVMAADLATLPVTGLRTQICGDAHVRNLGAYAAPDGHLVFDLNDFDETMIGPWEWDLKRLAASFILAGREAGTGRGSAKSAVLSLVRSYRETLAWLAGLTILDLLRVEIRRRLETEVLHRVLVKAERVTNAYALEKLTVRGRRSEPRFHDRPPLLFHVPAHVARALVASLRSYRETLGPDRQLAFDAYRPVDVAFKVVGTGSVGTRDFVVLLLGRGPQDPLFIQVKEALPSCYARYLPDVPPCPHQGRRVADGQHRMQSATDPLLGWTSIDGRDFIVRQLADHKAGLEPAELTDEALVSYALVCGEILAKAHARTGDAAAIAGYCGPSDRLDRAITRFAVAYADQTERDHARLLAAIKAGEVKAASEFRLRRGWHRIPEGRASPATPLCRRAAAGDARGGQRERGQQGARAPPARGPVRPAPGRALAEVCLGVRRAESRRPSPPRPSRYARRPHRLTRAAAGRAAVAAAPRLLPVAQAPGLPRRATGGDPSRPQAQPQPRPELHGHGPSGVARAHTRRPSRGSSITSVSPRPRANGRHPTCATSPWTLRAGIWSRRPGSPTAPERARAWLTALPPRR
jgi:uncharacterized protein (DUF2252 family)